MNQTPVAIDPVVTREASRRRTFAIISHPDAGKTTLTEKLLLYGGCVEIAGAVRGRKSQRAATSDWMELEKQRGISVSSTVLSFDFEGFRVNLLDTPGHHDFSEDTYRTLMAADCAVMVIDLAKGVETQTEKLFRVCAMRNIPVLTFVNKVDRTGKEPLEILANIEEKLGIHAVAFNWPLGTGPDFRGIVDRISGEAHLFDRSSGEQRIGFDVKPFTELTDADMDPLVRQIATEEWELVLSAGDSLDPMLFLQGMMTPVFFGSAYTNFGVEDFLRGFLKLCPSPQPRLSDHGMIPVDRKEFSGFVFKLQANLDPRHRDLVAFLRVCSGKFEREMEVVHPRSGKKIKLPRAHRLFAQGRETMDEGFPGDIIGLVNPGEFRLGDTICSGKQVNFEPLPQFPPENFAIFRCEDTLRRKQFNRGLEQLINEGAIQCFTRPGGGQVEPILAAVGVLQFDVVKFRLQSEYNTATSVNWLPYKMVRWIEGPADILADIKLPYSTRRVVDHYGKEAVLFESKWDCDYAQKENPQVKFSLVSSTEFHVADELHAKKE
ncbi:peptide chain release factor 3 [Anatilimnocola sp. NA78]|uniref:peptide chain release factor 3 n=1 Tax=Anatilimnocola sp. NA78 TaxID=3415683 RepID=UPI003CE469A9